METRKFLNHGQPQTLQGATILLYINAVFAIFQLLGGAPANALLALMGGAAAYAIANDKKIGFYGGLVVAALQLLLLVLALMAFGFSTNIMISLIFAGLLLYLLVHPMSRDYQRLWFK